MRKNTNTYDQNFKVKAVQLSFEQGPSRVARELGIAPSLMTRWRQEFLEFGAAGFCGRGYNRLNAEQKSFSELKRKLKNELKESELKVEIFKNGGKYISQGRLMIYHFIENNAHKYAVGKMCTVLGISYLAYRTWKNKVLSPSQARIELLKQEISSIFYEYRELYGAAKIAAELQSRGFKIKVDQVSVYMKKLGLASKIGRGYRLKNNIGYNPYAFANILNQQFTAEESSKAWVSGISRIKTSNGLLVLTVIMDLFDMKIIGWSLSDGQSIKETTIPAWEMAVKNRKIDKELIFHSDRAPQYANKIFTGKLEAFKFITRSMSRIGNQKDNAVPKFFFNCFKSDLLDSNTGLSKKQIREKICEYLETLHPKDILNIN